VPFGRRVLVFAGAAVRCFPLVPLADQTLRYVLFALGCVYVALAVLFTLNWLAARRS